jgi:transketolase
MKEGDRFILSNGHAAPALYVVLEEYRKIDSSELFETMGDHPKRNKDFFIDCSTGSLGMGITVAAGMAIANSQIKAHCLVSDGECAEGSVWETLRFMGNNFHTNFNVYFNLNGWSAYGEVDSIKLSEQIKSIYPHANVEFTSNFPFEEDGLRAHYSKLDKELYQNARRRISEKSLLSN